MTYQEFKLSLGLSPDFDARYDNGNLVVRRGNSRWQRINGNTLNLSPHERRTARRLANWDDTCGELTSTRYDPPINVMPRER